jgi:methionine sulfoxide reductase heme-binding subunit
MSTYILSIIFAAVILLIVAVISNLIKYEGGANPKDSRKRKIWFWIFAVLNPVLFYVIAQFIIYPGATETIKGDMKDSLPIATIVGFVVYIILGFVLSKIFKNGKIGNWF